MLPAVCNSPPFLYVVGADFTIASLSASTRCPCCESYEHLAVSSMRHAYMMLAAVCSSALFLYAVECRNGLLYTSTFFQACSAVPWLHVRRFCRKRTDIAVLISPYPTWTRCSRHSQVKKNRQQEPKLAELPALCRLLLQQQSMSWPVPSAICVYSCDPCSLH